PLSRPPSLPRRSSDLQIRGHLCEDPPQGPRRGLWLLLQPVQRHQPPPPFDAGGGSGEERIRELLGPGPLPSPHPRGDGGLRRGEDRKSTRLNSSHVKI